MNVTIIDYGAGNIGSIKNALSYLNCNANVTNNASEILSANMLILPGNGAFKAAISELNSLDIIDAILEAILIRKKKILGICLGMQLFSTESLEWGCTKGLGLYDASVEKLSSSENLLFKVPHIGFNTVKHDKGMSLFRGLAAENDFYFAHSYGIKSSQGAIKTATCKTPFNFIASFEFENIYATQFHPEKSQGNGLHLLKNFINI